jgi:DNA polymerase
MKHNPNDIITVDAETFYSTEFSLSKAEYNTSSYIRDPQFKEHCWAIKVGTKKTKGYSAADGIKVLQDIDWSKKALLAHNTAFDGFILSQRHGIVPHYYYDTVSMTRGLHNEVSRAKLDTIAQFYQIGAKSKTYLAPTKGLRDLPKDIMKGLLEGCVLDTNLCYEVFRKQVEIYPEGELDLIDMTIRMFCDPVLQVDETVARQALADEMMARRSEILKCHKIINGRKVEEADLMSNPKFAALLKECGIEPPTKLSLKTGLENFAFAQSDPEFTALLDHEDKRVVLLTKGRLAAKSTQAETRAWRLLQAGADGAKLPVGYNYFGAKTGRWSGTNKLNLQNLPRVNPYEPKPSDGLRRSIIAPKGHVLVVTDSAQIEARINAWFCGQTDVVQQFADKQDVYTLYASNNIYNKPAAEITKLERFIGKIAVLGLGYNMGFKKFQTTLALGMMGPAVDVPLAECQKIVKKYRAKNNKISAMWKYLNNVLEQMALGNSGVIEGAVELEYDPMTVWLPNGMGLHYPGLHVGADGQLKYKANGVWKKIYGGLLLENIVQALARIVVGEQMLTTKDMLDQLKLKKNEKACVVLMTHDEIVTCVPERLADQVLKKQLGVMRLPCSNWGADIPFDAEGEYAVNYSK